MADYKASVLERPKTTINKKAFWVQHLCLGKRIVKKRIPHMDAVNGNKIGKVKGENYQVRPLLSNKPGKIFFNRIFLHVPTLYKYVYADLLTDC